MAPRPTTTTSPPTSSSSEQFGGLDSLTGLRLLAVGCGGGERLTRAVAAGADLWGVDDSRGELDAARALWPDADFRLGRADDLPFDTGMFDVVCSVGALSGAGTAAAILEMTRVCRPGGAVIVWPAVESVYSDGGDPTY